MVQWGFNVVNTEPDIRYMIQKINFKNKYYGIKIQGTDCHGGITHRGIERALLNATLPSEEEKECHNNQAHRRTDGTQHYFTPSCYDGLLMTKVYGGYGQ